MRIVHSESQTKSLNMSSADLQKILAAISGVTTELGGVKAELAGVGRNQVNLEQTVSKVAKNVEVLTSEVEQQKENVTNLQEKFNNLETELRETREEVMVLKSQAPRTFSSVLTGRSRRQEVPTGSNLQEQEVGPGRGAMGEGSSRMELGRRQENGEEVVREIGRKEKIMNICEKSRRTIGFNIIDEKDIKRMFSEAYGGASTREQAKLLAVQEFMLCELKISIKDQEHMEIEDVFERRSEELDTLYVRFKHRSSLSRIFEKVKFLTNGRSNLITYIPREFQERFRSLNELLKPVRSDGRGWRTRVKMGQEDLIASKKMKQTGAEYEELSIDMDSLPPINLNRHQTQSTDSPPAGRPGHREQDGTRKRTRSGQSNNGASPRTKSAREEDDKTDGEEEDKDEEVDEDVEEDVSEKEKSNKEVPNRVTERRKKKTGGYCGPATISPVKEGQGLLLKPSIGEVREVITMLMGEKTVQIKKSSKV